MSIFVVPEDGEQAAVELKGQKYVVRIGDENIDAMIQAETLPVGMERTRSIIAALVPDLPLEQMTGFQKLAVAQHLMQMIARRGKDANLPFPEMPVVRDGRG